MTVTKIEAVTKTKYKVYIDGQFAFVLYKGELSRYHVEEGQEITADICVKIREEVLLKRARLRAMHLLNDMDRTESQLRSRLLRDGYPEDIVQEALSYVKSFGYVDDRNYARNFVDSRKDKKSRKEICMLLQEKGIPREEIEQALEEYYGKEDSVSAIERMMKKRHYCPKEADYTERQKFMGYLSRKGFTSDEIYRAFREVENCEEQDLQYPVCPMN